MINAIKESAVNLLSTTNTFFEKVAQEIATTREIATSILKNRTIDELRKDQLEHLRDKVLPTIYTVAGIGLGIGFAAIFFFAPIAILAAGPAAILGMLLLGIMGQRVQDAINEQQKAEKKAI